jgi:hypothetical protein
MFPQMLDTKEDSVEVKLILYLKYAIADSNMLLVIWCRLAPKPLYRNKYTCYHIGLAGGKKPPIQATSSFVFCVKWCSYVQRKGTETNIK